MTGTSFSFPFSSPFGGSGFSFVPTPGGSPLSALNQILPSSMSSGVDRMLDPVTLDYIRTDNGEWAETADSRTIVLIALSIRLGRSAFDPSHGTTIADRLENGLGLSPEFLQAETVRVGEQLRQEGIISDLRVIVRDQDGNELRDDAGRLAVKTEYKDLSSGSPVNATFAPR